MLTLLTTTQFRRDYKRAKKRGYNMNLLQDVLETLIDGKPLAAKHRDHQLTGDMRDYRECHIQPDWLLIYRIDGRKLILLAHRIGTHTDLFDE